VFIFVFFGGVLTGNNENSDLTLMLHSFQYSGLWLMAIGLFISHTASFILNYIQKGEFRRTSLMKLMIQPYGRVVILHIVILGSGFLIMMLGMPAVSLVILVFLKIVLDVWGHLRQHRDFSSTAEKTGL
jgi:uncharacterized protein YacL